MGIDLVWLDSTGAQRDEVPDPDSVLSDAILRVRADRESQLLIARIDPYADTEFTTGQAAQLFRELEALRNESQNPAERVALGRVLSVLRAAEGTADGWLQFLGD